MMGLNPAVFLTALIAKGQCDQTNAMPFYKGGKSCAWESPRIMEDSS